ncbi:hypothetical protein B0E48_17350 [Rhodanobacter sp. C03]|nr:hypothetical protein B0E48_17350 [Rhodanobacter sp. C03]
MIWLATIVLGIGAQIIMFSLQVGALRRYRHKSFWLLAAGSTCFATYAAIGAVPYFVTLNTSALSGLLSVGVAFALIGVVVGVWGTTSLFRRFGELQRAAAGVIS